MKKVVSITLMAFAGTIYGTQNIETTKIKFKNVTSHPLTVSTEIPSMSAKGEFTVPAGGETARDFPVVELHIGPPLGGNMILLTADHLRKLSGKTIELIRTPTGEIGFKFPSKGADLAECQQRIKELEGKLAEIKRIAS